MAFVFDATSGGSSANSYATVEFADDHFASLPPVSRVTWDLATTTTAVKQTALVAATSIVSSICQLRGVPYTTTQALWYPGIIVNHPPVIWPEPVDNVIHPQFARGICELAQSAIAGTRLAERGSIGIAELKAGAVELVFDSADSKPVLTPAALSYLQPFIVSVRDPRAAPKIATVR